MSNDFSHLITDRTEYDVMHAQELNERIKQDGINSLTISEREAWFDGLRGMYTTADLNRVESAVQALATLLRNSGYNANVNTRSWALPDIPTPSEMGRYLNNISALINAFFILPDTPERPANMERLGYEGANAIERILFDIHFLYNNMTESHYYLNEIYMGEVQ